jgi:hypothetical protein
VLQPRGLCEALQRIVNWLCRTEREQYTEYSSKVAGVNLFHK